MKKQMFSFYLIGSIAGFGLAFNCPLLSMWTQVGGTFIFESEDPVYMNVFGADNTFHGVVQENLAAQREVSRALYLGPDGQYDSIRFLMREPFLTGNRSLSMRGAQPPFSVFEDLSLRDPGSSDDSVVSEGQESSHGSEWSEGQEWEDVSSIASSSVPSPRHVEQQTEFERQRNADAQRVIEERERNLAAALLVGQEFVARMQRDQEAIRHQLEAQQSAPAEKHRPPLSPRGLLQANHQAAQAAPNSPGSERSPKRQRRGDSAAGAGSASAPIDYGQSLTAMYEEDPFVGHPQESGVASESEGMDV